MSIIYEKHYPHPTFEEELKKIAKYKQELESSPDYKPEPKLTFEEFCKNITENRILILLPRKMKMADDFIKLAIKASEAYKLDIKISKKGDYPKDCVNLECGVE